jgi:ATP-binding cassette subfamily B protein
MLDGVKEMAIKPGLLSQTWRRAKQSVIYRLVFENAKDHIPGYIIAFILLFIVSATTGLTAYMMEDVINEIFVNRQATMLFVISGTVAAIFIAKGAAAYGNAVILARIGNSIIARIQRRIFDKLIGHGIDYIGAASFGEIITRFTHNANAARNAINMLVVMLWRDVLTLMSLVTVMVLQDPQMSLIVFFFGPFIVYGVMWLMRAVKKIAQQEFAGLARINLIVKDTFIGMKVVKTYQLEPRFKGEMDDAILSVQNRMNAIARISAITVPLMEAFAGVTIALVIFYGGWQVVYYDAQPGAFFSFITAVLLAYEPARRLARFNVDFQVSLIGAKMLYEFLDTPLTEHDTPGAKPLAEVKAGAIRLENVSFAYGESEALRDVSLDIPAGKMTALVGPSGAGKSTLFALLTRLYHPQAGRILLDGTEFAAATIASVRKHIAIVSQDSWLFDGTIAENIACGRDGASEVEIRQAAINANASTFIEALPQGYDTHVGEGGGNLSGGQRQRISIARAMLKSAPILLLDEATSALDSITEAEVQDALGRLIKGRTTLVIAHRLSTVLHADQIVVMNEGTIVEIGTHEALLAQAGLYKALYEAQFRKRAA